MKKPYTPVSARINGRKWAIEVVDSLEDDPASVGLCDTSNRKILLVAGELCKLQDTLFHELIHAACPSLSEEQVSEVERGVYAVLADNPTIRTWLFKNG